MAVGLEVSKRDVDGLVADMALGLVASLKRIASFKEWLDAQVDADLIKMGYSDDDVALLRSAIADGDQVASLFRGATTLSVQKDFGVFLKRLAGIGQIA